MPHISALIVVVAVLLFSASAFANAVETTTQLTCANSNKQFLPNPESCTSFIHCAHGKPYIKECPGGLYWDDRWSTCNYPSETKCDINPDVEQPEPETDAPPPSPEPVTDTTPTTLLPPVTSQLPTTTQAPNQETGTGDRPCPSISNDRKYYYVADPEVCTKFYICRLGVSGQTYPCGQNLWFSSSMQACVRPEKSDCPHRI